MCMEEEFMPAAGDTGQESVTRYGLGARGIDCIEKTVDYGTPTHAYPVYDGHGNMVATISTAGTLSNQRAYDVWGGVRAQNGVSSNPSERYVGNLGHKSDDESGLIYMRARYYDPSTGRFVTEDPARDGSNWFVYCSNDPVNRVDPDGRDDVLDAIKASANLVAAFRILGELLSTMGKSVLAYMIGVSGLVGILMWIRADMTFLQKVGALSLAMFVGAAQAGLPAAAMEAETAGSVTSIQEHYRQGFKAYGLTLLLFLAVIQAEEAIQVGITP